MFITLEGTEGSGKTSQLLPLVEFLRNKGYTVYMTREPGGTSIGEQVREILSNFENTEMHPRTETLLFQAARAQFVEQVIRPRLAEGAIVISDRYVDSTLAYQGYGHKQNLKEIKALVNYAAEGLMPDLTIFFNISGETGLERKKNGDERNRLDAYPVEFHQRVHKGYLELIKLEPSRWTILDANQDKDVVQENLRTIILKNLQEK
jgi:dTMP kinase